MNSGYLEQVLRDCIHLGRNSSRCTEWSRPYPSPPPLDFIQETIVSRAFQSLTEFVRDNEESEFAQRVRRELPKGFWITPKPVKTNREPIRDISTNKV